MTEFTPEWVAKQREAISDPRVSLAPIHIVEDALDHIERQQTRIEELEAEIDDKNEYIVRTGVNVLSKLDKPLKALEEFRKRIVQLEEINQAGRNRIAELKAERNCILTTLNSVVNEAYLQDPFGDDTGMAILRGAQTLLDTFRPQEEE